MTQDELKGLVGQAALLYVPEGAIVGVGTGSTVNKFIDALATMKHRIAGAGEQLQRQHRAPARARHPRAGGRRGSNRCRSTWTVPTRSTPAAA